MLDGADGPHVERGGAGGVRVRRARERMGRRMRAGRGSERHVVVVHAARPVGLVTRRRACGARWPCADTGSVTTGACCVLAQVTCCAAICRCWPSRSFSSVLPACQSRNPASVSRNSGGQSLQLEAGRSCPLPPRRVLAHLQGLPHWPSRSASSATCTGAWTACGACPVAARRWSRRDEGWPVASARSAARRARIKWSDGSVMRWLQTRGAGGPLPSGAGVACP